MISISSKYPPLAPRVPLASPLAVFIEFTNRCNFKCSYCPESVDDYALKADGLHKLSRELFSKICADLREFSGIKVLRFYGLGETLLHPNAVEMISEACAMKLAKRTDITTNGSMLTPDKSAGLIVSGLDCIHVSVYGTTAKEMREFTRSHFVPSDIWANLRQFLNLRGSRTTPRLIVKVTTAKENVRRFLDMFEDVCDEVEVEVPHNWTAQERLVQINRAPNKEVCPAPFYIMHINSDGVVNCCAADWQRLTQVGDVREELLKSIWNGERLRAFRLLHLNRRRCENAACAQCDFINVFADNLDDLTAEVLR